VARPPDRAHNVALAGRAPSAPAKPRPAAHTRPTEPESLLSSATPEIAAPRPTPRPAGPDFVGIGVQKSGTTWIADVLAQHPGVVIREKEISFFVRYYHRGWRWYELHFRDKQGRLAGEFSVNYIYSPRSDSTHREFYPRWNPRRRLLFWRTYPAARAELAARYPDLKIIVAFRDPADRAWSHYWFWRRRRERNRKKVVPFERMFQDDGRWIRTQGYYADLLKPWRATFPDLKVVFFDDIVTRPLEVARDVYAFVGADPAFAPALEQRVNAGRYPEMPAETRRTLVHLYRGQIEELAAMTGRDLGRWCEAP